MCIIVEKSFSNRVKTKCDYNEVKQFSDVFF